MMASYETAETCSWYVIVHTNIVVFYDCCSLIISGVPRDFFSGGFQQIQLRTEDRENGDLGAVAP